MAVNWRNMSLRILSVAMALLLWIYATNEQNPVNDQILSLQIQRINQPQGMEISGIPPSVSVRVQGPRTQLASLTASDFQAAVDLSGLPEGDSYVPVKLTPPSGVQVVQVTPNKIHVVADRMVEKQVDVAVSFKGNPARGYVTQDPAVVPVKVTLKGPRSKVSPVEQLKVTVDVESADGVVEQTVPVSSGVGGVIVSPQTVRVSVPVIPLPSRTVPVRPRVAGEPAKDYEIAGVTVSPESVQVVAPAGYLALMNWVETEKVDVRGTESDVNVKIGVSPPPGAVEVKPAAVEVTVIIKKVRNQGQGTPGPAR